METLEQKRSNRIMKFINLIKNTEFKIDNSNGNLYSTCIEADLEEIKDFKEFILDKFDSFENTDKTDTYKDLSHEEQDKFILKVYEIIKEDVNKFYIKNLISLHLDSENEEFKLKVLKEIKDNSYNKQ